MGRLVRCFGWLLVVVVAVAVGGSASVSARAGATVDGRQLWVAHDVSSSGDRADASYVAAAPDGSWVFVATDIGFTTAYRATSGQRVWRDHLQAFSAHSIAVSRDGTRVFVTGGDNLVTAAYDAATGTRLWVSRMPKYGDSWPGESVAVSPDGSKVYATGSWLISGEGWGYLTVAYDAQTGARLWVRRYGSPNAGGTSETARAVAVSPDGTRVFVSGGVADPVDWHLVTIAYDAATGATLWVKRYRPGSGRVSSALAISPDGSRLVVTGNAPSADGTNVEYATVAYDSATGLVLWTRRYHGDWAEPDAVAFSPDGTQLAVSGTSAGRFVTIAYQAATGNRLWLNRFSSGAYLPSLVYAPDGTRLYLTGSSRFTTPTPGHQFATAALDASNGTRLWSAHYPAAAVGDSYATSLAVSPDGAALYVTGSSQYNVATLAYRTG